MNPGRLDLTVTRGDSFARTLQIDGLEAALGGGFAALATANFTAVVERRYYGPAAAQTGFAVSVVAGGGADSWLVSLVLTDEQTSGFHPAGMVWSLRVADLPGDVDDEAHTILYGAVTVVATTHRQAA